MELFEIDQVEFLQILLLSHHQKNHLDHQHQDYFHNENHRHHLML
jgi:hypothetical protein